MKFKVQPKNFLLPDSPNTGVTIDAIQVNLFGCSVPAPAYNVQFILFKDSGEQYGSPIEYTMPAKMPNGFEPLAGLMKGDKLAIYATAGAIAQSFGYTLLPIENQTELNELFPDTPTN